MNDVPAGDIRKCHNAKINSKVEDLALSVGVDPEVVKAGLPEAMKVWDAFVSRMPDRLATPEKFKKVLANNYELLYNMLEASGLKLGHENTNLRDQVKELEVLHDDTHRQLLDLTKWFAAHPKKTTAVLFGLDDGVEGTALGSVSEEVDDLPSWKVTFKSGKDVHSILIDHRDMSMHFHDLEVVTEDPDPGFQALVDDVDMDGGFDGEMDLEGEDVDPDEAAPDTLEPL